MIINGNRLELPQDEEFDNYPAVKKALITAGGKYKKCGFEFSIPAQEIKERLLGGEIIDDVKKYQYFPTPTALAERIVPMANIQPHHSVLVPCAGKGGLEGGLIRGFDCNSITLIELMPENFKSLERKDFLSLISTKGVGLSNTDFLTYNARGAVKFNRILSNPPFTKNQDIDHVLHMYSMLQYGGRIVSVMSTSWVNGQQKKQVKFREFMNATEAKVIQLDRGEFKESGTMVPSVIVIIDKK